ncbi:MAG TPA: hypothetical protein VKY25_04470, partial [Erysipelothrix sp.]|nr:hypothetical protein [Erysipelothrix sp.]
TTILTLVVNTRFENTAVAFVIPILILIMIGLFIAVLVMWVMAFIDLLYKSIYNKNGYRLFTMPVKTWEIVVAKTVVFFMWMFIIGVVTFIAMMIFLAISFRDLEIFRVYQSLISYILSNFSLAEIGIMVLSFISNNLITITVILFIGSVANSHFIQNRRALVAFVGYLILTAIISRFTVSFVSEVSLFDFVINDQLIMNPGMIDSINPLTQGWSTLFELSANTIGFQTVAKVTLIELLMSGLLMFGTVWMWDNKLEILN